ncbi:MAG: hypothetical protein ABR611_15935 [Chthoniobacterales bacterium]
MLRRLFSRRNLVIFGVCYGVVWLLTATVGVRQVRKMALHTMELDRGCVEIAPDSARPPSEHCVYSYRSASYAPFVVAVDWVATHGESSVWASGVVLWFGKCVPLPPFHTGIT